METNMKKKKETGEEMLQSLIKSLNAKIENILDIGNKIEQITEAVETLQRCGIHEASLYPIRNYLLLLSQEQNQIAHDALCK
jgi:hypothetical protein